MIQHLILCGSLCLPMLCVAQDGVSVKNTDPSQAVVLLFQDVPSELSDSEKKLIFDQLEIELSADGQWLSADFPVRITVYPTDMNRDSQEELFVVLESAAIFGNVGQGFHLFMDTGEDSYQLNSSGYGMLSVLPRGNLEYPDLLLGIPGLTFPIYRWDGKSYVLHSKISNQQYDQNHPVVIAEYSKAYQENQSKTLAK